MLTIELITRNPNEAYVVALAQVNVNTLKERAGVEALVTSDLPTGITASDNKVQLAIPGLTTQPLAVVVAPFTAANISLLRDSRNRQRLPPSQFQVVLLKGQGNIIIQNGRAKQAMDKCYDMVGRANNNSQVMDIVLLPQHETEGYVLAFAQVKVSTLKDPQGFKAIVTSELAPISALRTGKARLKIPGQTQPLSGYQMAILVAPVQPANTNLLLDPRNRPSPNVVRTCVVTKQDEDNLQRFPSSQFQVVLTQGKRNNILIRNGRAEKVRRDRIDRNANVASVENQQERREGTKFRLNA